MGTQGRGMRIFTILSKFPQQRGELATLGTGEQVLCAESFVMSSSVLSKLSDARDAQQFPLDIIFQKAMMMMLVPHKEDNYPVLKIL